MKEQNKLAKSPKLPELSKSKVEQAHSHALIAFIQNKITLAGGKISFSAFMEACLYAPGLGYYSAGATKFGPAGDFITAPEISDLFGQTLAEYYLKLTHQNLHNIPLNIIELGAGTGKLAGDILSYLTIKKNLPPHYYILEISADLKQKQHIYLKNILPDYFTQIIWLDTLDILNKNPNFNGNGLILANEVLDALPVELFTIRQNLEIHQTWIINHPDLPHKFEQISLPADKNLQDQVKTNLHLPHSGFDSSDYPSPYQSEINLNILSWLSGIEKMITQGQIIFIDYGFGSKEYYHPDRHMGTLMCHYQHRAHGDFLANIGLQDITAHVNFTQVAMAAKTLNLTIDNFTTQAEFLLSQNLGQLAEQKLADAAQKNRISITHAMQLLTAPHEMGELFKVLMLHKGDTHSIPSGRPHFHRL